MQVKTISMMWPSVQTLLAATPALATVVMSVTESFARTSTSVPMVFIAVILMPSALTLTEAINVNVSMVSLVMAHSAMMLMNVLLTQLMIVSNIRFVPILMVPTSAPVSQAMALL